MLNVFEYLEQSAARSPGKLAFADSSRSLSFSELLAEAGRDGNELLLSDILGTDGQEIVRPLEDDADREMLHTAISMLADREKQIILMRFGFIDGTEYTQKEVADMMGISQSYISRLEKRIIARLHREMLRQMQV